MNASVAGRAASGRHRTQRLSVSAELAKRTTFRLVISGLIADSALSKQLSILEEAGYVHIDRPLRDRRRRVRARLTAAGATAFRGHVAALREIVESADSERAPA